jgi:hypothetical protein
MRETERTRIFFDGCTADLIIPALSELKRPSLRITPEVSHFIEV